jgi:maltooligosyltrehalose trehalohydrolase
MTARTLLGPNTPMLFVSQEYGASSPFPYFADHERELAERVAAGRLEFLLQFPSVTDPEVQVSLTHAADPKTLKRSKLDHTERESHAEILALHRDLLRLRREDPVLRLQRARGVDGSVLGTGAFVLRFFGSAGDDRLLLVSLDRDLTYQPAPEPLLAPPAARRWAVLWSSEDTRYGGTGRMEPEVDGRWRITGHAAVLLNPVQVEPSGEPNRTISAPTRNTP